MNGFILLWSGTAETIPPGWQLCDGTNGTPDLRNRFVVCAGDTYEPGDSGGSDEHTHEATQVGHAHALSAGAGVQSGPSMSPATTNVNPPITVENADHRPLYYALCYIMKTP